MNKKLITMMGFMFPSFSLAVIDYRGLNIPSSGDTLTLSRGEELIITVGNFLIGISIVLAVIFIVWGGITWMTAGSSEDAAGKARDRIKNGIIGAAVVLGVGLIIKTIESLVSQTFFCLGLFC